jgi:glycosyltransferase involved in cell wall biosynthesis
VRPWQFLRALRARGHRITVVAPIAGRAEAADMARLEADGLPSLGRRQGRAARLVGMGRAWADGRPLQAGYAHSPALAADIAAELDRAEAAGDPYDLAHVEHLRGSVYALGLAGRLPLVWDSVDCITSLFEQARERAASLSARWMPVLELARTRAEEGRLALAMPRILVTSESDRAALMALALRRLRLDARAPGIGGQEPVLPRITVIPNGTDLEGFRPPDRPREPDSLVFSGKLSYHANVAAAAFLVQSIMPLIWLERPALRLILAGAEPSRSLRAWAAAEPRIELTGKVEDLGAVLASASVAVAPMVYGVGIQNKVLEAMACATPVVATSRVLSGLSAEPGRDLLVGETAEALAQQILLLFDQPAQAAAIGEAGRRFVERHHGWDAAAAALEQSYREAIADWAGTR